MIVTKVEEFSDMLTLFIKKIYNVVKNSENISLPNLKLSSTE